MDEPPALADAPILAAELHYFRIPPEQWAFLLVRLRQMGANTVSTYVPWCWHEPQPGLVDFNGTTDPRRNLVQFAHLCLLLGLRLILKPGPFVDAELLGGGIPPWLLQQHPEIHARRADDDVWRHSDSGAPRACYLHPAYLDAARRWIAAFSTAMIPFQHPAGPVVAVQADNETPGDGLLPADIGLDPRLRLDYNQYVVERLWPWFWGLDTGDGEEHAGRWERSTVAAQRSLISPQPPRAPGSPRSIDELRQCLALEVFTDWFYTESVATIVAWLRDDGWHVPVFHDRLAAPWQHCGTIIDTLGLARAAGWLGFNVYAEDVVEPFVGGAGYALSFEEYVHYGFWLPRLAADLSRTYPVFVPEISAAQDFYFATPLMGGAQALNVYAAQQALPEHPAIGALPRWAMEAPLRPDGSLRPRFWNAKTIFTLLGAAGADFVAARAPASVAIGYSHVPERVALYPGPARHDAVAGCDTGRRAQELAQRLVRAGIAFDVLDLDTATPDELALYPLLLVPSSAVIARATQLKLSACANLALVGEVRPAFDEYLDACNLLVPHFALAHGDQHPEGSSVTRASIARLPDGISAERIAALIEQHGGSAHYGWADGSDVDVTVRHGSRYTYIFIANRRAEAYSGTLTYRVADGSLQHLHVGIGGPRIGIAILDGDDVAGCAVGGDASEGAWLIRGMRSSMVFNGGAGVVAPCGHGLRFSAPHSGRFQVRRPQGWDGLVPYRLMVSGEILPAASQIEGANLALPYVAEDEHGVTDSYLLLPAGPAPAPLHEELRTLLLARAHMLGDIAAMPPPDHNGTAPTQAIAFQAFADTSGMLTVLADRAFTLDEYAIAWRHASIVCAPVISALVRELARARGERLAGMLDEARYAAIEARLYATLEAAARASLRPDQD